MRTLLATFATALLLGAAAPPLAAQGGSTDAATDARRYPCRTNPAARAFDFWVGTWDVTARGQHAGTNTITSILADCVLLEEWSGANGSDGKSMNFYDASRKHWRQVWVADGGTVLDYTGDFTDGAMRFRGVTVDSAGVETLQKLTFIPEAPDTVRQIFEASTDGGQSWKVTWEGLYVRRK